MIALVYQKKIYIGFSKANTKCCLSLHYNDNESYLYVNKTEIFKIKAKESICWCNCILGSVSKDFTKDEQSEISVNGTVYDFSVDRSSTKKKKFVGSNLVIFRYK